MYACGQQLLVLVPGVNHTPRSTSPDLADCSVAKLSAGRWDGLGRLPCSSAAEMPVVDQK